MIASRDNPATVSADPAVVLGDFLRAQAVRTDPATAPGVLVAVSGGADSMALLAAALRRSRAGEIRVYAAHLVHHPDSPEALQRAALVAEFCRTHDLPLAVENIAYHGLPPGSPEERMRRARYRFLESVAQQYSCSWILTGHHAGDQAETVLLRILLGTGIRGLAGIRPRRGAYLRPFLSLSKSNLEAWCRREGIPFADDPANEDLTVPRNRLRHHLLPLLRSEINPRAEEALCRLAEWAGEAQEIIEAETDRCWNESLRIFQKTKIALDIDAILPYFKMIRKNVLLRAFELLSEDHGGELTSAEIDRLAGFIENGRTGALLNFSAGVRVIRHRRELIFARGLPLFQSRPLLPGQEAVLPELGLRIRWESAPAPPYASGEDRQADLFLGCDPGELILRYAREGDRFYPLGAPGAKTLFRFLTDRGVSRADKRATLVLECRGEILWVVGHRIADTARIREISAGSWRLTLTPVHDSHLTESHT